MNVNISDCTMVTTSSSRSGQVEPDGATLQATLEGLTATIQKLQDDCQRDLQMTQDLLRNNNKTTEQDGFNNRDRNRNTNEKINKTPEYTVNNNGPNPFVQGGDDLVGTNLLKKFKDLRPPLFKGLSDLAKAE